MALECVIFDCDGVLVDTEAISTGALLTLGTEMGMQMTLEEASILFRGANLAHCIQWIEERAGCKAPEDFIPRFRVLNDERCAVEAVAIPGVEAVLENLTLPRCVATSAPAEKAYLTLGLTGLRKYFGDAIYSAYHIQKWKPDPDLHLHAAAQMGFDPSVCVVIEDSLVGVQAAVAAGMRVFGYTHGDYRHQLTAAGAIVFSDMADLPGLLAGLQA